MAKQTYEIAAIALLAALAAVLQLSNGIVGIPSPFGMKLDLAAAPVLLALFLFGFESALSVLAVLGLVIVFVSPDSFIGASMKLGATLPMLVVPALYLLYAKNRAAIAAIAALFIVGGALAFSLAWNTGITPKPLAGGPQEARYLYGLSALAVTALLAFGVYLLWSRGRALPLSALGNERVALLTLYGGIALRAPIAVIAVYYYALPLYAGMTPEAAMAAVPAAVIVIWNAAQGIVEFAVAWLLAYRYGFAERYGRRAADG